MLPQFEFEPHWLPRRPLSAPAKAASYARRSRRRALTHPYVEANPSALCSLVITDHDGGCADELPGLLGLPVPSYVALNPHTRSGHIVYALATPVCLTDAARRRPVNLLARIEAGLDTAFDGDLAYSHRVTKNPTHPDHLTVWGPAEAVYSLADLADPLAELGLLPKWRTTRERRRQLSTAPTGRNVELFDTTRKWAYPRRGDFTELGRWEEAVLGHALRLNSTLIADSFSCGPLGENEVGHLARSIAHWTWRRITRSYREHQGALGARGWTPERRAAVAARHEEYRQAQTDRMLDLGIIG